MPSKTHEALLRYHLGAMLWWNAILKSNKVLNMLNIQQLEMLEAKYPEECEQRIEIRRVINRRKAHGK